MDATNSSRSQGSQFLNEGVAANAPATAYLQTGSPAKYWAANRWAAVLPSPLIAFIVFVTFLPRPGTPVNEAGPEAGEGKNGGDVGTIGMHLEKPEKAVILEPEDDPTSIGRVRASECG